MALSKKDKDEIKLIVAEALKEIKLGKETSSAKDTPDFKFWKDNLIKLDCGLEFAPEDYYEEGKHFFTWDEAMEIEKKVLIPNGFRLPTLVDWTAAYCECGQKENGDDDPDRFEEVLKLNKNGYWNWNQNSEGIQGALGFFWSSTPSSGTNAYYLYYSSTGIGPQGNSNKGHGFSIRCVRIKEKKQ